MTDRIEIARQFLQDVLGPVPQDSCIELRIKRNDEKGSRQQFLPSVQQLDVTQYTLNEHVWFGVAFRKLGTSTGKDDDLTWAPCVWADFDNVPDKVGLLDRLKRFEAPPTTIVDSGGGLHAYWRLNRLLDMRDAAQKLYVQEVSYGLAHILGADETVHDPTRVLRVAGSFNPGNGKRKIYDPPREATVLRRDAYSFPIDELSKFRRQLPPKGAPMVTTPAAQGPTMPLQVGELRIPQRLRALVESGWVQGCGYPSRSELDQAVAIAMLRGGHTPTEIAAVFQNPAYKISEKFFEKGGDGPRYLAVTIAASQQWIDAHRKPTPGGALRESNGQIETARGNVWRPVFNRPIKAIAKLTGEETGFRVEIATPDGPEQRTLRAYDMASNFDFKRALGMAGAWTGTNEDVQLLIPYLEAQRPPTRRAVRTIGLEGEHVIFPNAHLDKGVLVEDTDYLYLGKLTDARLEESDDWPALAQNVFTHLPLLHTRGAIIPIIGWFMATFLAPRVRKLTSDGAFPLLMVFGTPEAGKTTILELMRTLTGIAGALHSAPDNTRFANIELMSSTSTVPVVYDEHRRNDVRQHKQSLYPLLREAYQSGIVTRGRPDLTVVRYRLQSPVALGGETPFRDSALIDRTVHVRLDRGGKNRAELDALMALSLHQFDAGFYRHSLSKDLPALWKDAQRLLPSALSDNALQVRQKHAWTVVALGLLLIEPFWSRPLIETLIRDLSDFRGVTKDDVAVSTKAVVLEAVRIIAELVRSRRIRDGIDYMIKADGSEHYMWIVPSIVLPAIEEYCQRYPTDLPMAKETIMGRMREDNAGADPVVKQYQATFKTAAKVTARGIALHLEQVAKEMDIPVEYWTQSAIMHAEEAPQ